MKKIAVVFILISCFTGVKSQDILYKDDFTHGLSQWIPETESDSLVLQVLDHTLDIVSPKGLTLWFDHPLEDGIKISYEARMVSEGGKYDRVSDLNCFWMANDPDNPLNFFSRSAWRKGTFGKYYSLTLYYVGYGGNNNTTTRFRKYNGDYQSFLDKTMRPDVIREYTDQAHLITAGRWNTIEIVTNHHRIQYLFNNEVLFDYSDPQPYAKGYFGIRTVSSHLQIRNFKVSKMQ